MAPLKLLMTADAVGGVWTYAIEQGGALAARGHRVTLAATGPAASEAQRAEAGAAGLALLPDALPLDWLCDGPAEVLAGGERLATMAADHDLLLLNSPGLAARARFPVPVIAVAHGDVGTWWQAARAGVALDPSYGWLTNLIGEGLRTADRVVAPTAAHGEAVRAFYGLERVEAVHNGRTVLPDTVLLRKQEPIAGATGRRPGEVESGNGLLLSQEHEIEEDAPTPALTVGRLWDAAKDLATLNAAAALTSVSVRAVGALTGPSGERADLPHLDTPGPLPHHRLAALLAKRPVFVSTATYEPFGLAVLEAAQAGCPLVLSDIPTFRELWDGAATFVPPRDAPAVARAIEAPLASGDAARERAARYTVDAMAEGMLTLIRDTLAGRVAQEQAA